MSGGAAGMETRKPTLREKIQKLRLTFLDKLPDMILEGRGMCGRLLVAPGDAKALDDLFRAFHTIKGTAASFGLNEISDQGGIGETLVTAFRNLSPPERAETAATVVGELSAVLDQTAGLVTVAGDGEVKIDHETKVFFSVKDEKDGFPSKRVFLCDDDQIAGEHLIAQLTCFGYEVVPYSTTDALRTAVLANAPDAVIMDIMFPDGINAGTEIIDSMRRELSSPPPVVFLSARRDFDARLRSVQAGGQAYFTKPVKVTELVETLDVLTNREEPDPYRVLVVDDEKEVAEYHGLILEEAGMSVRLLYEPSAILDVLTEFRPDMVLMDMYMPTCSGRDLSQLIRQIPDFISLPIVFLSNETNKVMQISALRVGAEGFLTKPIQPDDLITAVAVRAERMRTLRSLMVRDGLTGLFNHTFLSQYLVTALATAKRETKRVSLVMLDIDHFKTINDSYGHPAGDQVLVALSRLLQQRLRRSDMLGRYGGEEFAVIMQNTGPEEARLIVDGLREDFSRLQFQAGERSFSCTFSGGVAGFPDVPRDHLMEAADQALYRAKRAGRNRVAGVPAEVRS
ncbi:diguanylate cyclase [Telmatospirillum sp.]|uniref:GGDEF domain-containing response regulator n=1 Tax=Telmatospirillum sp. TaxID=2079197 RepID=UPI002849E447|nr:diguanylate cyclase [Telmatospirillum sp.]MDR3437364.1 diguanylate cyclase [Telmatospirillum sp.]